MEQSLKKRLIGLLCQKLTIERHQRNVQKNHLIMYLKENIQPFFESTEHIILLEKVLSFICS